MGVFFFSLLIVSFACICICTPMVIIKKDQSNNSHIDGAARAKSYFKASDRRTGSMDWKRAARQSGIAKPAY
jgi:hypothetical protein